MKVPYWNIPTIGMRRAAVHRRHSHITPLARRQTTCSSWTIAIHARQSHCDYTHTIERKHGAFIKQATPERVSVTPWPITAPRRSLRPVTQAHILDFLAIAVKKQRSTSSFSSGGARVR